MIHTCNILTSLMLCTVMHCLTYFLSFFYEIPYMLKWTRAKALGSLSQWKLYCISGLILMYFTVIWSNHAPCITKADLRQNIFQTILPQLPCSEIHDCWHLVAMHTYKFSTHRNRHRSSGGGWHRTTGQGAHKNALIL